MEKVRSTCPCRGFRGVTLLWTGVKIQGEGRVRKGGAPLSRKHVCVCVCVCARVHCSHDRAQALGSQARVWNSRAGTGTPGLFQCTQRGHLGEERGEGSWEEA